MSFCSTCSSSSFWHSVRMFAENLNTNVLPWLLQLQPKVFLWPDNRFLSPSRFPLLQVVPTIVRHSFNESKTLKALKHAKTTKTVATELNPIHHKSMALSDSLENMVGSWKIKLSNETLWHLSGFWMFSIMFTAFLLPVCGNRRSLPGSQSPRPSCQMTYLQTGMKLTYAVYMYTKSSKIALILQIKWKKIK